VHGWVHSWAALNPDGPAITCDGRTLSWSDLDERVDVVAEHLLAHGIRPGDRVGCLMPNSVEFVETLHAASRVGAVFVPLNTRYTASELAFASGHAGLSILLVDDSFATIVGASEVDLPLVWRSAWPVERSGATATSLPVTSWSDDGFLLFTSGSTGTPRAVLHAQAAFMWTSQDALLIHGFNRTDTMVTPLPLCFTGGMNVVTGTAHAGVHLVLMSSFAPDLVFDLIEEYGATIFHGVPLMCQRLVDHPRWETADLSTMRLGRTGAAPVASGLMQAWMARGIPLTQGYGSTESGGAGFTLPVAEATRYGKCGRASFTVDVRIVSAATGEEVPVGEVGEVLIRGPQVMRAYWREPAATAAALRDGWLWTGDLAFVDQDGLYEIAGRSKDLIITGGLNVYPAEVEHVLRSAAGVADAAVVGIPSVKWGEEVVAVLVAEVQGELDVEGVLAHCRNQLADYKCPKSVVVSTNALDRTASGKIIKREVERLAIQGVPN
jgi:fatty-acyl-CoA synthase